MSGPVFNVDDLFDEDYLYFYEPRVGEVSDAETEVIWRLASSSVGPRSLILPVDMVASRTVSPGGVHALPAWMRRRCFFERARADAAAAGAVDGALFA